MKPVLLIPSVVLCLSAGWWLDGYWSRGKSLPRKVAAGEKAAAEDVAAVLASLRASAAPGTAHAREERITADTGEELLALYEPGEEAKSRSILRRALEGKTKEELSALIRQLARRLPGNLRAEPDLAAVAAEVIDRLLLLDPADGVDFAFLFGGHDITEGDGTPVMEAMQKVFKESPDRAAEILARHGGATVMTRFNWLMSLEGNEPRKALDMIVDFDRKARSDLRRLNATGNFPREWVKQDAPAAMAWALALPPGYSRHLFLQCMGSEWARMDPAAARAYLNAVPESTLPAGPMRDRLLSYIGHAEAEKQKESPPAR